MLIEKGMDGSGFCSYMECWMPSKRESTVRVGYGWKIPSKGWKFVCFFSVRHFHIVRCFARLKTWLKEFCEHMKNTRVKKIHFCIKMCLLRSKIRCKLFFNTEENSGAVLICGELQIAFRKLDLKTNTNRTVI